MPKFTVTKNMGSALKNLRQFRKIKAIDIAKAIDKTSAYISKLEKGELNNIDQDDLFKIISTMSTNEEEFEEAIKSLLTDTTMEYTEDEVANEEWKMNIDKFFRRLPIPDEYINLIKEKIQELNISVEELSNYIGYNSDLYNDGRFSKELLDSAPKNKWVFNNGNPFVVMEVSPVVINNILNKKVTTANYNTLSVILISLFRLEKLSINEAYDNTFKLLKELKVQTLTEKLELMEAFNKKKNLESQFDQRNNEQLPVEDTTLITHIYDIYNMTNAFARITDINYVNSKLSNAVETIKEDPVLFMGYIGVDLSKLKKVDIQIKKEFVKAISELVDEYSIRKPKEEKHQLI